ncbi:hypothetical protein IAU60_000998 [Kwoniella sp. DSM 27419]
MLEHAPPGASTSTSTSSSTTPHAKATSNRAAVNADHQAGMTDRPQDGREGNDAGPSRRTSHYGSDTESSSMAAARRHSASHTKQAAGTDAGHDDGEEDPTSAGADSPPPRLDIATYPTQQLLRLIAGLLQHIATSNDALRPDVNDESEHGEDGTEARDTPGSGTNTPAAAQSRSRSHSHASYTSSTINPASSSPTTALFEPHSHGDRDPSRPSTPVTAAGASGRNTEKAYSTEFPLFTASRSSLSHPTALLAFHARHIPSISIEAYLLRILKYCPTTNEVFLGLLVYFDRMTRLGTPQGVGGEHAGVAKGKGFAIDSYNVHRLVIAGVTVASKFFSDVFYTNSRYAKVGGLPSTELNSLELQFLLINDFRLRISLDEMQKYGDRLLAYAAEEEAKEKEREEAVKVEQERAREERRRAEQAKAERSGTPVEDTGDQTYQESTSRRYSQSQPATQAGSSDTNGNMPTQPSSQPRTPVPVAPRPSVASSAIHAVASSGDGLQPQAPITSGLREWVRGEEVMGRMASPMRD